MELNDTVLVAIIAASAAVIGGVVGVLGSAVTPLVQMWSTRFAHAENAKKDNRKDREVYAEEVRTRLLQVILAADDMITNATEDNARTMRTAGYRALLFVQEETLRTDLREILSCLSAVLRAQRAGDEGEKSAALNRVSRPISALLDKSISEFKAP